MIGLIALALLFVPSALTAAPSTTLDGVWIGGFLYQGEWVTVAVRFESETKGLNGAADVSFADYQDERGVALAALAAEGSRVRFTIPVERGPILVDARAEKGILTGTYQLAKTSGSFGLTHVTPVSPEDRAAFYGAYELERSHVVAVFDYGGSNLRFVDYPSGQQSTLYPVSKDTFVSGPGQTMAYPIAHTFRFVRAGGGKVTELRWRPKGEKERVARRMSFAEVPLTCTNGAISLAGTLILPEGKGTHPAIVVTPGDFGTIRDGLRGYAYNFVRLGIAALVFDSRGGGASTGAVSSSTFSDLADDALAWVALLRQRNDLDPAKIGVFGFSNSAWTVTLAASQSRDVAFLISQSMSALPPWQQERYRAETQVRLAGFSKDDVDKAVSLMDRKFEVARTGEGWDRLEADLKTYEGERWLAYINPPRSLERLRAYWDRSFSYDPAPALEHVTCPAFFIYGSVDSNVPVDASVPIIRRGMEVAGNKDYTIKVFPQGRHDLIEGVNGGPVEFTRMKRFAPGYWDTMSDWVVARVIQRPSGG